MYRKSNTGINIVLLNRDEQQFQNVVVESVRCLIDQLFAVTGFLLHIYMYNSKQ